jgi:hypothetical protein
MKASSAMRLMQANFRAERLAMVPRPRAIDFLVCDYFILDERTKNVSLIGCFNRLRLPEFPFAASRFYVFALLTDGLGEGLLELTLSHLASEEEIFRLETTIRLPHRFTELRVPFPIVECYFPEPGAYLFTLLIDNEIIGERRFEVALKESAT